MLTRSVDIYTTIDDDRGDTSCDRFRHLTQLANQVTVWHVTSRGKGHLRDSKVRVELGVGQWPRRNRKREFFSVINRMREIVWKTEGKLETHDAIDIKFVRFRSRIPVLWQQTFIYMWIIGKLKKYRQRYFSRFFKWKFHPNHCSWPGFYLDN